MNDTEAIKAACRSIYAAMLAGSTDDLTALLAEEFTLTHMTGRVQSKDEWLADIDAERMVYHEVQKVSASVSVSAIRPCWSAGMSWSPPCIAAAAGGISS